MSEAEAAERVVVTLSPDSRRRDESGLLVAALAELRGVVAVTAIRFARVRRARVTRKEVLWVVAALGDDVELEADVRAAAPEVRIAAE